MKADVWRQLDFFDPSKAHPKPLIIGCGHIGSYLAFGLARMGVKEITICDHDLVEAHNLPNQFFAESLMAELVQDKPSLLKVVALQETIKYLVPTAKINIVPSRIEAANIKVQYYDVVFVCVDDMNVRKWIFDEAKEGTKLIIDARTGGAFANVFSCRLTKSEEFNYYAKNLWSNKDAAPLPCTGTAVIDVSFGVVSDCIHKYREYVQNKSVRIIHSFHDYIVGTVSIMKMINVEKPEAERIIIPKEIAKQPIQAVREADDGDGMPTFADNLERQDGEDNPFEIGEDNDER